MPDIKQTRLGYRLRKAVERAELPTENMGELGWGAMKAAADLDRAVYSLGVKGDGILLLGSYRIAKQAFKQVTGEDYVPEKGRVA